MRILLLVLATLALTVPNAYAALIDGKKIKKNSITAKQIKAGGVASSEIKNNSIIAADIRPGVIGLTQLTPSLAAAITAARIPGPMGPTGPTGANAPSYTA